MNMHEGFNLLKHPAEACKHQSFCRNNYSYTYGLNLCEYPPAARPVRE